MKYYSTNGGGTGVSLEEAVVRGLAHDGGLYMPERFAALPEKVVGKLKDMSFHEIACAVARSFLGEDLAEEVIDRIVCETLSFEVPVVRVEEGIYSLELFHGPTLAFKDVGARFMARLLAHFIRKQGMTDVHVLVATSGDTGSAVANGFLGVEGIRVHVLYPKGKVSPIQECQFTTLGRNITAIEVDGVFDDCQRLVKAAFSDASLSGRIRLTSANSINIARLLPQSFYYFDAYAQLARLGWADKLVIAVPSGNFGNLTAGLFAHRIGLPVVRFIAANNCNDVFFEYLRTGEYRPRPSIATLANAMDVGDPSNFARILALYDGSHATISGLISGYRYDDAAIADAITRTHSRTGYMLDPHGACAYLSLTEGLRSDETGVFLETAHPAKFKDTVDPLLPKGVAIPNALRAFMQGQKQSVPLTADYADFKDYLLSIR
jgi:threonine synthase